MTARIVAAQAAVDSARQDVARARAGMDSLRARVQDRAAVVTARGVETWERIERAKEVVADTTATVKVLRTELHQLATSAEIFRADVLTYQRLIDSVLVAQQIERQSVDVEREALQRVIDEQAIALQDNRCGTRWVPCVTRWQAFGIGFTIAIAIVAVF